MEESQSPSDLLEEGAAGGGRGRAGGGQMGGRGGRGGRGNPQELQERMAQIRALIQSFMEARSEISVEQNDSMIVLTYAAGSPIALSTDGKEQEHVLRGFGKVKVKAEWRDGLLVLERAFEGGTRVREEFQRGVDSPRLIVMTRISGSIPRNVAFRSVYDRDG